ncbi:uncharacterized protein DUF3857 [Anseongella ginsenosidimutans]|uniref:Uncharacterized protein DUF3857 n=1 Tax=Anseongella ginsenosidimutans TaxID=496056 RepID=A0A4R3KQN1_9SPHI|nr:DUF3857 domain-containing protein [Anseongella ginsenosidimutans]QEC52843.1 DUF3857 domain-containing protein [Anseongella ginsenosidimutans]TCS87228.1 uncharacterized protein DUF3857 [Anseongella ginsenosidimutans]
MNRLKTVLMILAGCLAARAGMAQEPDFSVEQIPGRLLESADAVTRYSHTQIMVNDPRNMTWRVRKAITVLNPAGEDYGVAHVFYDKSRKIAELKAGIYNASGRMVRAVKEKEFTDQSAISDISIYEDTRVKYYRPGVREYPYTVFYEYEIRSSNTHYFPEWFPARSPLVSVQDAVYEVICSNGFQVRVKEMHISPGEVADNAGGARVYRWKVNDLPARGEEPFAPPSRNYLPHVMVAPVDFEYEGMKGSFSNWEQYGQWVYERLLSGRDEVPEATAAKITQLLSGAKDDREKVARVYQYVQEKNRYVSVQVGIGGLQPMQAEDVDRLSYGDCKGLVNYTKALLSVAGIPSIYTEVAAGDEQRSYFPEFASFLQGNHIILCVPLQGDTVWLECTSKEAPFNYLGTFTAGRNVLLITPEGGKVTRTPYCENSGSRREATFTMLENGEAAVEVETDFTGALYYDRYELSHANPRQADELLKKLYPLNNLYVEDWKVSHQKEETPLTKEKLLLRVRDFGSISGGRLFLPLNPLNRLERVPVHLPQRRSAVFIAESYEEKDVFEFKLPETYKAEYLPENREITKPFGKFSLSAALEGEVLVYKRVLRLNKGTYPPESYQEVIDFFQEVQQADYQKAVLLKP